MQTPTDAEIEKNKHLVPKRENDSDCQGLKYGNQVCQCNERIFIAEII